MTVSQPARPFWQVVGVFDPDGAGADFAYTVGLATRGRCELHMWARPTEGHDPGHDWSFNPRERAILLNDFARDYLEGNLDVGAEVVREFDGGATVCTFRFDPPEDPAALDAFQAAPDSQVIPIRWTLARVPEGPLTPVTAAAQPQVLAHLAAVTAALDPGQVAALPAQWRLPQAPVLDPDQPYGPTTPLVLAYAAQAATADVETLARLCDHVMLTEDVHSTRHILGLSAATARPVGRTAAITHVHETIGDLVDLITGKAGPTRRWRDLLTQLGGDMSRTERDQFSAALARMLHNALAALLCTAVLDDVADDELRLAGYGPWAWAISSPLAAPAAWRADDATLTTVTDLLADLNLDGLLSLVAIQAAMFDTGEDDLDPEHAGLVQVARWLAGMGITTASGLPDLTELLAGTPAGTALTELAQTYPADAERVLVDISSSAALLSAALVHADALGERGSTLLAAAYGDLLPDFVAELDRRRVAADARG